MDKKAETISSNPYKGKFEYTQACISNILILNSWPRDEWTKPTANENRISK